MKIVKTREELLDTPGIFVKKSHSNIYRNRICYTNGESYFIDEMFNACGKRLKGTCDIFSEVVEGCGHLAWRWEPWMYKEVGSTSFKRVILESPYAGDVRSNLEYARLCVKDSLNRGESPIASHLLYAQEGILDDNIQKERQLGIDAGLAWKEVADYHVFYIDYGYSSGMRYAKKYATANDIRIIERKILNRDI